MTNRFAFLHGIFGLILGGFYALWQNELISKGFGVSNIATIIAIQTIILIIIDIPSGIFADKLGNKRAVIIGIVFYLLAFIIPSLKASVITISTCVLVIGLGGAFISGAIGSWAADIQELQDGALHTKKFLERDQAQRIGMVVGALSIPFFASLLNYSYQTPWSIFFLITFFLLFISLSIPNPDVANKTNKDSYDYKSLFTIHCCPVHLEEFEA